MLGLLASPLLKFAAIAAMMAALFLFGCSEGQKRTQAKWDAERVSLQEAVRQAMLSRIEIERKLRGRLHEAEVEHQKAVAAIAGASATELGRLRNAAASRGRSGMPSIPAPAVGCAPCPRCATSAELFGIGEDLIRVAEAADRERAAVMACAVAWPK